MSNKLRTKPNRRTTKTNKRATWLFSKIGKRFLNQLVQVKTSNPIEISIYILTNISVIPNFSFLFP